MGETFIRATAYRVAYSSGPVLLAGDINGSTATELDDIIMVKVVHQYGSSATYRHDYSRGCQGFISALPPLDLSSYFEPGQNTVIVTLRDTCGAGEGASGIWLLP